MIVVIVTVVIVAVVIVTVVIVTVVTVVIVTVVTVVIVTVVIVTVVIVTVVIVIVVVVTLVKVTVVIVMVVTVAIVTLLLVTVVKERKEEEKYIYTFSVLLDRAIWPIWQQMWCSQGSVLRFSRCLSPVVKMMGQFYFPPRGIHGLTPICIFHLKSFHYIDPVEQN